MTSRHVFEGTTFKNYTLTYNAENQLVSVSGNLASKNGATYTYNTTHKHAVASLSNGNSYGYDDNGNMTSRSVNGQNLTLNYDAENRLVAVTGAATANFYYDADGKQVKSVVGGVATYYVGNHYEVKNSVVTKYYFAGATRLAVRTSGTLFFLLGDHLGSSSVTTDANGVKTASALYKAFGESRYSVGDLKTDYRFTGQRVEASLGGIYFFQSRWFDPSLGRFMSPDTIVPTGSQGTQAWDRYAFVNNNPVRYNDPTGHMIDSGCETEGCSLSQYQADMDAQKLALLEAEAAERECKAGNDAYCSPLTYAKMIATGERKIGWDASLVPWDEVTLDAIGLVGDLTVAGEGPATYVEGAKLLGWSIAGVEAYTDVWSIKAGTADPVNVLLNTVSIFPGIGALTSAIGLVYNLSQGFYLY
jgi:RHS repeat-associated protein